MHFWVWYRTSKSNSLPSGNQTWLARQIHHLLRWFPSYKAPIIGCFFPHVPWIFSLKPTWYPKLWFLRKTTKYRLDSTHIISPGIPSVSERGGVVGFFFLLLFLFLLLRPVSRVHGVSDHLDLLIWKQKTNNIYECSLYGCRMIPQFWWMSNIGKIKHHLKQTQDSEA